MELCDHYEWTKRGTEQGNVTCNIVLVMLHLK